MNTLFKEFLKWFNQLVCIHLDIELLSHVSLSLVLGSGFKIQVNNEAIYSTMYYCLKKCLNSEGFVSHWKEKIDNQKSISKSTHQEEFHSSRNYQIFIFTSFYRIIWNHLNIHQRKKVLFENINKTAKSIFSFKSLFKIRFIILVTKLKWKYLFSFLNANNFISEPEV